MTSALYGLLVIRCIAHCLDCKSLALTNSVGQMMLADSFGPGDYIGLQSPRIVREDGLGLHIEIDGM